MAISMRQPMQHPRRHGRCLEPVDRRLLERAGWRTTLDYRENHVRARNGQLVDVQPVWTAEAERFDGALMVASATGFTEEDAWAALRVKVDMADVRSTLAIRVLAR
jgi:hypothetical protein